MPRNFLEDNRRVGPNLFLSSGVNLFQSKVTSAGNQYKSEEHIQIKWVHKLALTFHVIYYKLLVLTPFVYQRGNGSNKECQTSSTGIHCVV